MTKDTISIDRHKARRIMYDLDQIITILYDEDNDNQKIMDLLHRAVDDLKVAHDTSVKAEIDGMFKEHDRLMAERDRVLGLRDKLFPDETD